MLLVVGLDIGDVLASRGAEGAEGGKAWKRGIQERRALAWRLIWLRRLRPAIQPSAEGALAISQRAKATPI